MTLSIVCDIWSPRSSAAVSTHQDVPAWVTPSDTAHVIYYTAAAYAERFARVIRLNGCVARDEPPNMLALSGRRIFQASPNAALERLHHASARP